MNEAVVFDVFVTNFLESRDSGDRMDEKAGVLLQLYSRARAPNRDYFGLTITREEVILNTWNITHGPHVFPKKQRCSLDDLSIAKSFLEEVLRLFGMHVVDYLLALARAAPALECLPTNVFLRVLQYLPSNDILNLGATSKIMHELCNRNSVWRLIFVKRNHAKPSRDECKAAETKGWKIILKNKIVWSDRLQRIQKNKPSVLEKAIKAKRVSSATNRTVRTELEVKPTPIPTKITPVLEQAGGDQLKSSSLASLPLKSILKKPSLAASNTTSKLATSFMAPITETEHEDNTSLKTIHYTALNKKNLTASKDTKMSTSTAKLVNAPLSTLLSDILAKEQRTKGKSGKDQHLDKFLAGLDKPEKTTNPYRALPPTLANTTKPKSTLHKKLNDFCSGLTEDDAADLNSTPQLTSKFEQYLNSIKGRTISPLCDLKPKHGVDDVPIGKGELIPRINDLGKSINQIRSSFFSTDSLRMKMNNSKVANVGVGKVQQLNNQLNVVPSAGSSSVLDVKRNALKLKTTSGKSATSVVKGKVKNTNCSPSQPTATAMMTAAKKSVAAKKVSAAPVKKK